MKIEEAIHELLLQKDNSYDREVTDKTCDMAIVALKRQMPILVVNIRENGFASQIYGDCPICKNAVYTDEKYCSGCGQALKWE